MLAKAKAISCCLSLLAVAVFLIGGGSNGWKPLSFNNVQHNSLPIALLIYDPKLKKNHVCDLLDGKDGLDNGEVKEKLKNFTHIKVKNDQSDSKGWPDGWLKDAENGAVLFVLSGDMKELVKFDKSAAPKTLKSEIIMAAEKIAKYQEREKAAEIERQKEHAAATAAAANAAARNSTTPTPVSAADDNRIPGMSAMNNKKATDKSKDKDKKKDKDVEE